MDPAATARPPSASARITACSGSATGSDGIPGARARISSHSCSALRALACGTVVAMNADATGRSGVIIPFKSLSLIAAKTIGSFRLPVSCRYDASAAAPAGLCAASISRSPHRRSSPALGSRAGMGTRSHSRRAGHSHSVRPVTIASVGMWPTIVDHRSRIATATAAFSNWWRPCSASVSGGYFRSVVVACASKIGASTSLATLAMREAASFGRRPMTSGTPRLAMPAFSNAI